MKKKVIAIVLAIALIAALVVGLVACGKKDNTPKEVELPGYNVQEPDYSDLVFPSDFKVGLITLHDKNSTYDANFINALEQVKAEFGLRYSPDPVPASGPDGPFRRGALPSPWDRR